MPANPMNENEYRELCLACDALLQDPAATPETVANEWLHVVREHPVFLDSYVDLFESTRRRAVARLISRHLRQLAVHGRQMFRALMSDGRPWFGGQLPARRVDVVFISHAVSTTHVNTPTDFYFGSVPASLADEGYSVAIVLMNHTREHSAALSARWQDREVPRFVLSRTLGVSDELRLRGRLRRDRRRLRSLRLAAAGSLRRRVSQRAAHESLSNGSLSSLRIGEQVSAIVRAFQPRMLVTTHEGHAWERMAYAAARAVDPGIVCVGYQHAAIFRLQHAIRRRLFRGYDPDHILTAGRTGKTQLSLSDGLAGIGIEVLGSDRAFSAPASAPAPPVTDGGGACVVLPESLDSECRLLFDFSLDCARRQPATRFLWRLHPLMTVDALVSRYPRWRHLPANVSFSTASLDEDLARCRWALYRGTTAIVKAVGCGLRPIYLESPGEISIDPLYDLAHWKVNVRSCAEFQDAVAAAPDPQGAAKAIAHCASVFVPFDASAVTRILTRMTPAKERGC